MYMFESVECFCFCNAQTASGKIFFIYWLFQLKGRKFFYYFPVTNIPFLSGKTYPSNEYEMWKIT